MVGAQIYQFGLAENLMCCLRETSNQGTFFNLLDQLFSDTANKYQNQEGRAPLDMAQLRDLVKCHNAHGSLREMKK